jgi:hypothetical protein
MNPSTDRRDIADFCTAAGGIRLHRFKFVAAAAGAP